MEPEKDTVEGVLADLIDLVEWKEEAWLLQREELHRRQWLDFIEIVAQHNRCAYACRTLPYEQCWRVFDCTDRECELVASKMRRSNPYRQRYLTCAECAESCWTIGECECDLGLGRCTEDRLRRVHGPRGVWYVGSGRLRLPVEHGTCPRLVLGCPGPA